jgi:endo-1,4-beta-xylanase
MPQRSTFRAALAGLLVLTSLTACVQQDAAPTTLKDAYKDLFPIGAAVSPSSLETYEELIASHFSSVTAENVMKFSEIHPAENTYRFEPADNIVAFAREHGMLVRGHTLVWHNQTPAWLFRESPEQPMTKELLLARMKSHITEVMKRYDKDVYVWDVVNEAISDERQEQYRESPWLAAIGPEYVQKAFEYAHEADPDALLFYNDYSVVDPVKREKIYFMIKGLLEKGVRVHGIGMQGHWNLDWPSAQQVDETIALFASLGLQVHITELDISFYPWEDKDTRYDEPPAELLEKQAARYKELFEVFRKHKDAVTNVTFWGVTDNTSWLNTNPVVRTNWPLLFDRTGQPKPAFDAVLTFE